MAATNPQGRDPVRLERAPEAAPPDAGVERRRRGQALMAAAAGAVVGVLIGLVVDYIFDPRQTAYRWSIVFALGLIGLFAGGMLAETRVVEDVDAPIRDVDAASKGRAATAEEGQLPGSPVKPVITGDPEDRTLP
jgi:MFS family permease